MSQDVIKKLQAPFHFEEVEAKIQVTTGDKTKGMAVFYLDSRAIQKRLDEVLGPSNWKNQYYPWQNNAQLCGISLYDSERNEWIEKCDGAENSDIEAVKGGLTDAFKRSAVLWGVGRYLYQIDGVWVDVEQRGKGSFIKDNQRNKLEAAYNAAIKKMFGITAPQIGASGVSSDNKPPSAPQDPKNDTPSKTAQQAVGDNQLPTKDSCDYTVKSIKPSGKASQLLELIDTNGELTTAYVKVSNEAISTGSRLREVVMERKSSSYGQYNLVNSYQLVA